MIYTSYIHDLRELRKTMSLLRSLEGKVYLDQLTGINNRRYLYEQGDKEFQKIRDAGQPISCIFFDIDFFKTVNDTYGHPAGDEVLKQIAATAQQELRQDDILTRYGGEEFVALLPRLDETTTLEVAERIRLKVMDILTVYEKKEIKVTVSLGVSSANNEINTLEKLILCADQALYLAKNSGRNNVKMYSKDFAEGHEEQAIHHTRQ